MTKPMKVTWTVQQGDGWNGRGEEEGITQRDGDVDGDGGLGGIMEGNESNIEDDEDEDKVVEEEEDESARRTVVGGGRRRRTRKKVRFSRTMSMSLTWCFCLTSDTLFEVTWE